MSLKKYFYFFKTIDYYKKYMQFDKTVSDIIKKKFPIIDWNLLIRSNQIIDKKKNYKLC